MDDKNQQPPSEEELKELMETIKQLEEEQKKNKKKTPKGMFVIEFGGVYHPNLIINFLFSLLMNISIAVLIVELFNYAEYINEFVFILFVFTYTVIEGFVKYFMTVYYIQYVIKTFGFLYYLAYIGIFYITDMYLFTGNLFRFTHEYTFVAFTTIFVIGRYILGTSIRRHIRGLR